ncbi:MAG: hypothetical protein R3A52_21230 [Polyangiales bacterium]
MGRTRLVAPWALAALVGCALQNPLVLPPGPDGGEEDAPLEDLPLEDAPPAVDRPLDARRDVTDDRGAPCPPGYTDCAGACVSLQTDESNCGACGRRCDAATGLCVAGTCQVGGCPAVRQNCDRDPSNGCEVDLSTDLHCGGCGWACAPARGRGACAAGVCALAACDPGYSDCDHDASNGCEVALATDADHCGACGARCALPNAVAACVGGACAIARCDGASLDCDGVSANGCEVDPGSDPDHCGACGRACPSPSGASGVCALGACTVRCAAGRASCDGNLANGCEVDLSTDARHCGACGTACAYPHASGVCAAGRCGFGRCDATWGNCDGNVGNGCEVDTTRTANHCGACGNRCAAPARATATCSGGACGFQCAAPFLNCDGVGSNGCEVDPRSNPANCGSCGHACPRAQNADAVCTGGRCATACAMGFGDCDANASNGCEVYLPTSTLHCGMCGRPCPAGAMCNGGRCECPAGQSACGGRCCAAGSCVGGACAPAVDAGVITTDAG